MTALNETSYDNTVDNKNAEEFCMCGKEARLVKTVEIRL